MRCMKCGTETQDQQIFCDSCLAVMDKFPIKPGTPVSLPNRPAATAKAAVSRRRIYSVEERLQRTRRTVKWLAIALVSSLLALVLTVTLLVHTAALYRESESIGKNYNTVGAEAP